MVSKKINYTGNRSNSYDTGCYSTLKQSDKIKTPMISRGFHCMVPVVKVVLITFH